MRFEDLFCESLLAIRHRMANPVENIVYSNEEINYVYNNYGYRTHHIPDKVLEPHWLVVGCSHTEGIGVHAECRYTDLLEKTTGIKIFNLGQAGGNSFTNELNIFKWIENVGKPQQIIAQWPSPYRNFIWNETNTHPQFAARITAKDDDPLYNLTAKYSTKNFLFNKIISIIATNKFCRAIDVKIFNFCIHHWPIQNELSANGVNFHNNLEHQWTTDGKAADFSHHSKNCHAAWAQKILELIK